MKEMKIPFSPPDITQAEIDEVVDTLRSGWITTGPKTKKFEKELAAYSGVTHAACMSSQTTAAEMTLRLLGIGEGDEVIVPAYTYTASASVVCHVGAKLVLVDSQTDSVEMDYEKLDAAITPRTKVIIPVDIAGIPCDYDRIYEIVRKHKDEFTPSDNDIQKAFGRIIVMADAAHSLGARYKGKPVGDLGDFTNVSFHAVKNLTTAEGGAVIWRDISGLDSDDLYKRYMLLSLHGQTKDAFSKTNGSSWEYDIIKPAYKTNMTDIQAAMGLAQLHRYEAIIERRHSLIERYNKALEALDVQVLEHKNSDYRSSGHLYFVRFPGKDGDFRNRFYQRMLEKGVSCNVHYKPLPMMTAYKNLGFDIEDYPNAYALYKNELTLPLNSVLTDEEAQYVIDKFIETYQELS